MAPRWVDEKKLLGRSYPPVMWAPTRPSVPLWRPPTVSQQVSAATEITGT